MYKWRLNNNKSPKKHHCNTQIEHCIYRFETKMVETPWYHKFEERKKYINIKTSFPSLSHNGGVLLFCYSRTLKIDVYLWNSYVKVYYKKIILRFLYFSNNICFRDSQPSLQKIPGESIQFACYCIVFVWLLVLLNIHFYIPQCNTQNRPLFYYFSLNIIEKNSNNISW